MGFVDLNDIALLKTLEYGLTIACPTNEGPNPPHCPLHDIRLLPTDERFKWVDALSDEEAVTCYIAHMNCYSETVAQN